MQKGMSSLPAPSAFPAPSAGSALSSSTVSSFTCVASGSGLEKACVREPANFLIEVIDSHTGTRLPRSGLQFVANITGPTRLRARIHDQGDGSYAVEWRPIQSGRYRILLSLGGSPLRGSPFSVVAVTPEPSAAQCAVRGEALRHAVVRSTQTFEVAFRDRLGAVTHASDLDVFVEPALAVPASVLSDRTSHHGTGSHSSSSNHHQLGSGLFNRTRGNDDTARSAGDAAREDRMLQPKKDSAESSGPHSHPQHSTPSQRQRESPAPSQRSQRSQRSHRAREKSVAVEVKHRSIRVKVGEKTLLVRKGSSLESEPIGQLLPGAIITVLEERISANGGHVRALVSLEHLEKEIFDGVRSARSASFRSNTARGAGPRDAASAKPPLHFSEAGGAAGGAGAAGATAAGTLPKHAAARVLPSALSVSGARARLKQPPKEEISRRIEKLTRPATTGTGGGVTGAPPQESAGKDSNSPDAARLAEGANRAPERLIGAAHERQRHKLKPMRLSAIAERRDDESSPPPSPGGMVHMQDSAAGCVVWAAADSRGGGTEGAEDEGEDDAPKTGWVTLVKDGQRLVSSRLRLDASARQQQQQQWARRMGHDRSHSIRERERELAVSGERMVSPTAVRLAKITGAQQLKVESQRDLSRAYSLELTATSDATSFAFGGVYPGVLHAHGKPHAWHKVSYSIGVAGKYLLHVRLRKQAVSLPGSPFPLNVEPGMPFALASRLSVRALSGEVGEACTLTLAASDRMGNPCDKGGGHVTITGLRHGVKDDNDEEEVKCKVVDRKDGSYELCWTSERTGTFVAKVMIDGHEVLGSPIAVTFTSSRPVLSRCELWGPGLSHAQLGEPATIYLRFKDQYLNVCSPTGALRAAFRVGMQQQRDQAHAANNSAGDAAEVHEVEGAWAGASEYALSYKPEVAGTHLLHLYCLGVQLVGDKGIITAETNEPAPAKPESRRRGSMASPADADGSTRKSEHTAARADTSGNGGKRALISLPGAPWRVTVENPADDSQGKIATAEVAPQDYTIQRSVFEEAQKRWGACTIDAFASPATAMLPRFWTASASNGSAGVDAFAQEEAWGCATGEERIWAHPPPNLLSEFVDLLSRPQRMAEVIVCAPAFLQQKWFLPLAQLSDGKWKLNAGKLQRIAPDAPSRIIEWPVVLFHIPAREDEGYAAIAKKRDAAAMVIQRRVRHQQQ